MVLLNYEVTSIILTRPYFIKDLGVILDRKLSFNDHIDAIISTSMAMLAFLKRNSSEFSDPYTIRPLYVSLVRPHLEYCAILWNPVYSSHCLRIERVQKNFTRYVFYKLNWQIDRPSYSTRCALFGLSSLENRRKMFSVLFVRDLVHSHIQCPELLELLNFYAPSRSLRGSFHLVINFSRTNFMQDESINRCASISNSFLNFIDLFNMICRPSFKVQLLMILNQSLIFCK